MLFLKVSKVTDELPEGYFSYYFCYQSYYFSIFT